MKELGYLVVSENVLTGFDGRKAVSGNLQQNELPKQEKEGCSIC